MSARRGTRWTNSEETNVLEMVQQGKSRSEIATAIGRTSYAIYCRLSHIATEMIRDGSTPESAAKKTGLTVDQLQQVPPYKSERPCQECKANEEKLKEISAKIDELITLQKQVLRLV